MCLIKNTTAVEERASKCLPLFSFYLDVLQKVKLEVLPPVLMPVINLIFSFNISTPFAYVDLFYILKKKVDDTIYMYRKWRYKLHTFKGYKRRRKFPRCHHEVGVRKSQYLSFSVSNAVPLNPRPFSCYVKCFCKKTCALVFRKYAILLDNGFLADPH